MNKVFDYSYSDLVLLKKRNTFIAISSFVIGAVISTLLLLLHNRENSTIMAIFCVLSIFIFSIIGFIFLLVLNAPIGKIMLLVKKQENALTNEYEIIKIDENIFSEGGLSFKKILVKNGENEQLFYLLKNIDFAGYKKIKLSTVNSFIVSFEVLK